MNQPILSNNTDEKKRHERSIRTSWDSLLFPVPTNWTMEYQQIMEPNEIYLIKHLLHPTECSQLINMAETYGFGKTNYAKNYRGNLRLITTDFTLAHAIWERIQQFIPPIVYENGKQWTPIGLNEVWRLAKYHPGDQFKPHIDAFFQRSPTEKSMFTVNIYLNDGENDFTGGKTRFFNQKKNQVIDVEIQPLTGLCVLFRQPSSAEYLHDGEKVLSGIKYLLRSDVMYQMI